MWGTRGKLGGMQPSVVTSIARGKIVPDPHHDFPHAVLGVDRFGDFSREEAGRSGFPVARWLWEDVILQVNEE